MVESLLASSRVNLVPRLRDREIAKMDFTIKPIAKSTKGAAPQLPQGRAAFNRLALDVFNHTLTPATGAPSPEKPLRHGSL